MYQAIQGDEDKRKPLNPDDAVDIANNWNEMFG